MARPQPTQGPSRLVVCVALAALGLVVQALVSSAPSGSGLSDPAPPPPPLWGTTGADCGARSAAQALELARRRAALAQDKDARHPFSTSDAIDAVGAHARAADCFRTAGQPGRAEIHAARGEALREELQRDFRTRQLRLERALQDHDLVEARAQIRELRRFLVHRPGEYAEWLDRLERAVELDRGDET